jgi:hypothetical protein
MVSTGTMRWALCRLSILIRELVDEAASRCRTRAAQKSKVRSALQATRLLPLRSQGPDGIDAKGK